MGIKSIFAFVIFVGIFTSYNFVFAQTASPKKCAILLHGLARSSFSMKPIERKLKKEGYVVWNKSYESTKKTVEKLSPIIAEAITYCDQQKAEEIYFASHSMGGILIRHYFQTMKNPKVKAVVMLAPPNKGSEIVDEFKDQSWFKWYNGPAGLQLTSDEKGLPKSLKPISIPIGIITGNVSSDPWFSYLFKGPNDGKVSVESAKLDEMKDFLLVEKGHTFIMNSSEVHKQILHFFDHQTFNKN